jgi:hypothetical protein
VCAQTFPVTEEVAQAAQAGAEFHVLGVIERKALLRMLQHRIGLCGHAAGAHALPAGRRERRRVLSRFEQRPLKASSPGVEEGILRRALPSHACRMHAGPAASSMLPACSGRWARPCMPILSCRGSGIHLVEALESILSRLWKLSCRGSVVPPHKTC